VLTADELSSEEIKVDLCEIIENRRTIHVFKCSTTEDQLKKIILAGTKATSGMNCQPWLLRIKTNIKKVE
jgi:nitroreductase